MAQRAVNIRVEMMIHQFHARAGRLGLLDSESVRDNLEGDHLTFLDAARAVMAWPGCRSPGPAGSATGPGLRRVDSLERCLQK